MSDEKVNEKYIVIFPGASDLKKMWAAENFGILCRKISEIKQVKFLICGNESDKSTARKIMEISGIQNINDKTRDGSLIELIDLISDAELLITNDTCALHIGAALNTKTICISNGLHFARFHPYPNELSNQVITFYPNNELNKYNNYDISARKFHLSSDLDINKISCEEVFNSVKNVIASSEQEEYLIKTSETVNL